MRRIKHSNQSYPDRELTAYRNVANIGPDADSEPGAYDNVRVVILASGQLQVDFWLGSEADQQGKAARRATVQRPSRLAQVCGGRVT